jgi:multiple sugar transport system permease protein
VEKGGWRWGRYKWAYIILVPAAASIFLWQYLPMGIGSAMVLQDYRVVGESHFVGLQNFADVLWDATWWKSLLRTAYYMILFFCLGFWTPIALAILLYEVSRFKILYRTIYYLPAMLTGFVVIYLWKLMFDPSEAGTLNQILAAVGLPALRWLDDDRLAMLCCVIPTVWAGMGAGCLIYLAALKSVPDDLYEAADLDGCGFWGKIRHITLPTLKSLIIIQFVATFIASAQSAGFILVMTGMKESTKVAELHIFERAYMYLRFGSAVAMAWIFGVFLLTFTVQQLKILSRMEFRAQGAQK